MKTRSSNKKKTSNYIQDASIIPYDASCYTLEIPHHWSCPICVNKRLVKAKLLKAWSKTELKFRLISKRNKCEQRWTTEFVSGKNATDSMIKNHRLTCRFLNIRPAIELIDPVPKGK